MVNKLEMLMLFSLLILMIQLKKKMSTMRKLYITTNDFHKVSSRVFD